MRISISEKLMRQSEYLSRAEALTKILSHPRFEIYAPWFITGKTIPHEGQVTPPLNPPPITMLIQRRNPNENKRKTCRYSGS